KETHKSPKSQKCDIGRPRSLDIFLERITMMESIPRTVHRELQFEHGRAIGTSNRWEKGQYCSILTPAGIVGCGIYDLEIAAEFDLAIAIARGTPACPLVEPEDLFEARIVG